MTPAEALARMLYSKHTPACSGNPACLEARRPRARDMLATPEGAAMAALIEAAVAWRPDRYEPPGVDATARLVYAVDAWNGLGDET